VTSAGAGSLTGKQLGDFQLQGLLGAGGMAEVYRGFDVKLKRVVAVKVLPASLASDPNYVQRFRTEAQRVAALNHPHIVPVYHFGEEGPLLFHVMPLFNESLRDRLEREGMLTPKEAVRLIVQIASALSVAHGAGLVHRDVKPENILLNGKDEAFLTDFGIARPVTMSRTGRMAQTLSATGLPVGTPEYMAPEQLRGESIDERADIYALGAVLYELLTGRPPHEAETPYQVAALSLQGDITPPSTLVSGISEELEDVVMIALASDPAARYPDASSFGFAARRAVFPKGTSLLTALPGLRRTTRENAFRANPFRARPEHADELPTEPPTQEDSRVTAAAWLAPGIRPGGRQEGARRIPLTRRTLFVALAVAVLVVSLCGAASLGVAHQMNLPVFGFGPTAHPTATLLPSPTPTLTPVPSPTPTSVPTVTPAPPPAVQASFVKVDTTTGGNWTGKYGGQGYLLAPNDLIHSSYPTFNKIPGYLIVNITSEIPYPWVDGTTDTRALQKPSGSEGTGRIAACWYSSQTFTIDIGVTDGETHRLAMYVLDWDGYGGGRVERIVAVNATTGATLDSRTVGQPNGDTNANDQFRNGKYLVWLVRGHVRFTVTNLNSNAVVSGIFFD
jgi:serine/threonine-protein kinase